MRNTSIGISTIIAPFKLNMMTIVKSKAINVMGEMVGIKCWLNHCSPFHLIKDNLEITAAANGIPK